MDAGMGAAFILQNNHTHLPPSQQQRTSRRKSTKASKAKIIGRGTSKKGRPNTATTGDTNSVNSMITASTISSRDKSASTISSLPQWQRRASQRIEYLDTSLARHSTHSHRASTSSPRHVTEPDVAPSARSHFISAPVSTSNLLTDPASLSSSTLSSTHDPSAIVWPSLSSPPQGSSALVSPLSGTIDPSTSLSQAADAMPSVITDGKWRAWTTSTLSKRKAAQDEACDQVNEALDSAEAANMVGQLVGVFDSAHSTDKKHGGKAKEKSERRTFSAWKSKKTKEPLEESTEGPLVSSNEGVGAGLGVGHRHMSADDIHAVGSPPKLEPRSAKSEQNENFGDMCEILQNTRMGKEEMQLNATLSQPLSQFEWDSDYEHEKSPTNKIIRMPKLREQFKSFRTRGDTQTIADDAQELIRSISRQFPPESVGGSRANAFRENAENAEMLQLSHTPVDVPIGTQSLACKADFPRTSIAINRMSVLRMFNDPIWQGDSITGYDFKENEFVDGTATFEHKYAKKSKLKASMSMPSVVARARNDAKRMTRDDSDLSPSVIPSYNGKGKDHVRDRPFTISPEVSPHKIGAKKASPIKIPVYQHSVGVNESSPNVSTPRSWSSEATMALPPPPVPPIPVEHLGRTQAKYFSPVAVTVKKGVYHSPKAAASSSDVASPRANAKGTPSPLANTSILVGERYEDTAKERSPFTTTTNRDDKEIIPGGSSANDAPKMSQLSRLFAKKRSGRNESIQQSSAKVPQQHSFTVLRHANASQPENIGKIKGEITASSDNHDPVPVGLGISSRAQLPPLRNADLDFTTYFAGADGTMQHASMIVEPGHGDHDDAASQWESVQEEQESGSDYDGNETLQTSRTAQSDSVSIFTCQEAVPHPLNVHKQRQVIGGIPVMKVSRSSKLIQLENFPSFSPKRDSTFIKKIKEASQLQQAKTFGHPALRDSPFTSMSDFSSSSPNDYSPVVVGSPLKHDTTFIQNSETGRVDSGINMDAVNSQEETTRPLRYQEMQFSPSAYSMMSSPSQPFMDSMFTQRDSGPSSKPSLTISSSTSRNSKIQDLRTQLGMDPLRYYMDAGGTRHPNHNYVWNHENLMCHSLHNVQQFGEELPAFPTTASQNSIHNYSPTYSKYDSPTKRGKDGIKTIERCTICRKVCCRFAEYLLASKSTSQEVGEAANRLKAQSWVEVFRSAYPTGIDVFATMVKCQECGNKVCPACAFKCKERLCQMVFCKECGMGSDECPVHVEEDGGWI